MVTNPKVSIIIPAYNVKPYIANCLDSCIKQTFQDIEIIVVNDGSTDGSEQIIEEYQKIDSRIIAIHKQNENIPFARKSGIKQAKGEFVFHLDGDDTLPANTIEVLYNTIQTHDADIAVGNLILFKNNSIARERSYAGFGNGTGVEFLEFILVNHIHYLCGKLIKRALYTDYEIDLIKEVAEGEDQVQLYQLCIYAKKVTSVNNIVYNYLLNDSSITQKRIEKRILTTRRELYAHALFALLKRFDYNDLIRQQINLRILSALFEAVGWSGTYVVDIKKSRLILYKTLLDSIFTRNSLLFKHYKLLAKCAVSPIYYKLKRRIIETPC